MSHSLCTLCPRKCNADRIKTKGFCGASSTPVVSKIMMHRWEEPCICYGNGSGAIFFSGCQLRCVFCQNYQISSNLRGKELTSEELSDLFLLMENRGACNINLVSPTPYVDSIIPALENAKKNGLSVPVLYNSGGYESAATLKRLEGLIDIYLPDFKFYSKELSTRYAKAYDYAEQALASVQEMLRQTGTPLREGERLLKGVIVRHLVLPGASCDSVKILELLAKHFSVNDLILSIMRQYTPMHQAERFPELSRSITSLEYGRVIKAAQKLGFQNVYTQSSESIGAEYVPDFSIFDETN